MFLILFVLILNDHYDHIKRHHGLFMFYFMYLVSYYYIDNNMTDQLRKLLWIVLTTFPLWCYLTVKELLLDPYAVRNIKDTLESYSDYYQRGVGSYLTVYSAVIVGLACFYMLLNQSKLPLIKKVIFIIGGLSCFLLVIYSGYSIANISLLLGLFFLIITRKANNNVSRFKYLFICIFAIVVMTNFTFVDDFIDAFVNTTKGTPYYEKITDLKKSITGSKVAGESVEARSDVYYLSLNAFVENPILGSAFSDTLIFGNHSEIIDSFALYGVFIAVINSIILISASFILIGFKEKIGNLAFVIIWANSVILIFNNVTYTYAVALLIVVPAVCSEAGLLDAIQNERIDYNNEFE